MVARSDLPTYEQMDQIWDDFLVSGYVNDDYDSIYTSSHDMALDTADAFLRWYDQRLKKGW